MASGMYTGYQHQLLDMENLTKEAFIDFCDKAFYHLDYFGTTLEEQQTRGIKRRVELEKQLSEAEENLETVLNRTDAEWENLYKEYVNKTVQSNKEYRETYEKETTRMAQVWEYVAAVRPHLEYIWEGFKQPELFQIEIQSYDDFKEGNTDHAKWMVHHRKKSLKEMNNAEARTNERIIAMYEEKKAAFLGEE